MLRLIYLNDSLEKRIEGLIGTSIFDWAKLVSRVLLANNMIKNRSMILATPVDSQRNDVYNLKVAISLELESE